MAYLVSEQPDMVNIIAAAEIAASAFLNLFISIPDPFLFYYVKTDFN